MLAACAAGVPASQGASKGQGRAIAVAPFAVDGVLAQGWMKSLRAALNEGLSRGGGATLAELGTGHAEACANAECWAAVARRAGADFVVLPRLGVEDRDFRVELVLVDQRGTTLASAADTCEVCAVPEVAHMLADLAGVLNSKLDVLAREPPQITFESQPDAALVYLDGELLGQTPVTRSVTPGQHRARAVLRGRIPLELMVEAVAGSRETVAFELDPIPRSQRARPYGWALLGLGVAATATGIGLLAVDERPYRKRCDGRYLDVEGNCRFRYDTLGSGVVMTSVGGASLIAGTVIVALFSRRRASSRLTGAGLLLPGTRAAGLTIAGRL